MAAMRFAGMALGASPRSYKLADTLASSLRCDSAAYGQRGGSPTRQACTSLTAAQHKTASILPIALLADRRR